MAGGAAGRRAWRRGQAAGEEVLLAMQSRSLVLVQVLTDGPRGNRGRYENRWLDMWVHVREDVHNGLAMVDGEL